MPGCDRARVGEVSIGGAVRSLDLACSGARTRTVVQDGRVVPGLDFAPARREDGHPVGPVGQALALQRFAAGHRVRLVVVSIGGNDFGFGAIVRRCVTDFLTSPSWWPHHCATDDAVRARFTPAAVRARTAAITAALNRVGLAMTRSGYRAGSYTVLVQDYPSVLPRAARLRYPQTRARQTTGGCGIWDTDADWADEVALARIDGAVHAAVRRARLPGARLLAVGGALVGHRLCERGAHRLEEAHLDSWRSPGAAAASEWVQAIRTVSALGSPYAERESLHPDHWAQLALRNCLRQAWHGGDPRGGRCVPAGSGVTPRGEPRMLLRWGLGGRRA